jgi:transcriptional regulator with XRE-family HTH domain
MEKNRKTIYNPAYHALVAELVRIRRARRLSQRELAKKLEVSHCFIGRTETFERRLDMVETVELCEALGLQKSEILNLVGKLI